LLGSLMSFLDELGFGFGWASVYLTVMLSWWRGQTIGKRLFRIRVLRLDGEPITWWVAFERAGGYAAGLATGLLGFAQVYWDANRQAIHDRIVGTVVVLDAAPKVLDWESAL
ncbi:MAG TPA: RDD family protein, partial [Longimicrobiales bacterium]|nr:RDD family protein [Longimicrobiales bacterium]